MKILKKGREARIKEKLRKLRSRVGHRHFITNIGYPSQQKDSDKSKINNHLKKIEETVPQIKTFLKEYRKNTPNIWDQTKFSASYLLMCKAYTNLGTLILLAKRGANQELVEISRSALESLDLALLFLEDEKGKLLKDWFKGEIISNQYAREAMHDVINKESKSKGTIPVKDVKSDIYETYSLYTHSSYVALLDSVDVFYEDYDFKNYAGYLYTSRNLHLIDNIVINILLNLKNAFIKVRDLKNLEIVDNLMKTIGYKDLPQASINELFKDYRPQK